MDSNLNLEKKVSNLNLINVVNKSLIIITLNLELEIKNNTQF